MSIRALVVDDDDVTLQTFVELLELNKICVIGTATNGLEAVKQYKFLRPDVVFLDIIMPQYDGVYALENIKKEQPNANIIMVTGGPQDEMDRVEKLNPSWIIQKPFKMCTILHVLQNELCLEIEDHS